MKSNPKTEFKKGMSHGIPIALGYFAVSFTFGIASISGGLSILQAVLISLTNVTSAGQFTGLTIMIADGSYLEIALTQFIINLRYCLMSFSLGQKLEPETPSYHRYLMAFGVTDEIFALGASRPTALTAAYHYGVMCAAIPGWVFGTFLGAVSGNLLPTVIMNALGIAIYGMFLAIIIPPAKTNRAVLGVVIAAMLISASFAVLPALRQVPSGFVIIITTVVVAAGAAWLHPVPEQDTEALTHEA